MGAAERANEEAIRSRMLSLRENVSEHKRRDEIAVRVKPARRARINGERRRRRPADREHDIGKCKPEPNDAKRQNEGRKAPIRARALGKRMTAKLSAQIAQMRSCAMGTR